jgi:hypothetical protein
VLGSRTLPLTALIAVAPPLMIAPVPPSRPPDESAS